MEIKLLFDSECVADSDTPVAGMVFSDCENVPGMSGSPVFRTDADGGCTIVGVTTGTINPIGKTPLKYFIYSKVVTPFIRGVFDSEKNREHQMLNRLQTSVICIMAILTVSLSTAQERRAVDPSGPFAKRV